MKKNQYIVIGLGRFGRSVARHLEANGCMVMAVDVEEKAVNMISEYVTHAVCMDITDEEAVEELGLGNFDGAVISIGQNLDAAIFATMWAKEQGVGHVIAKAYDRTQGKILTKVGADEIIYPEEEMGQHLAKRLAFGNLLDKLEISEEYSIREIAVPQKWVKKNLKELHLREKYQVNVIAVRRNLELEINPSADQVFCEDDVCILLGKNSVLEELQKK